MESSKISSKPLEVRPGALKMGPTGDTNVSCPHTDVMK